MIKHLYDEIAKRWLGNCDSIWVISDTHFGDVEVYDMRGLLNVPDDIVFAKEQGDDRSYELFIEGRIDFLDEMQIKNINSKAGKNSCLIIIGDIGNLDCVKKLKAKRKILIMGNHDKGASNYKREYQQDFDYTGRYSDDPEEFTKMKQDGWFIEDNHFTKYFSDSYSIIDAVLWKRVKDNHLFDEVYEGPVMINDRVILSHEPIPVPSYMFNIHGHVHNAQYKGDTHHLNCCAEAIDYTPINLLSLFKNGLLKDIDSIHRETVDRAIVKKENKKSNKLKK